MNQLQDEVEEHRFNWIISVLKMENIHTDFKLERKSEVESGEESKGFHMDDLSHRSETLLPGKTETKKVRHSFLFSASWLEAVRLSAS